MSEGTRCTGTRSLRLGVPGLHLAHGAPRGGERSRGACDRRPGRRQASGPSNGTEVAFDVDTVLVAVGLSPVNELFEEGQRLGLRVYSAGRRARDRGSLRGDVLGEDRGAHDPSRPRPTRGGPPKPGATCGRCSPRIRGRSRGILSPADRRPGLPGHPLRAGDPLQPVHRRSARRTASRSPKGTSSGGRSSRGIASGACKCVAICPGLAITHGRPPLRPHGAAGEGDDPVGDARGARRRPATTSPRPGFEGEPVGSGKVIRILSGQGAQSSPADGPRGTRRAEADRVAGVRIREPEPLRHVSDVAPPTDCGDRHLPVRAGHEGDGRRLHPDHRARGT